MYLRKGRHWEAFQLLALRVGTQGRIDDVVGWFEPHLFRLAGLPMALHQDDDGGTPETSGDEDETCAS